jgi:N-acetylglucosamine kinase
VRSERYVAGVDGGASKTVALVGTQDGRILGRGEYGPSNYHNIGSAGASKAIANAINEAKKRAGLSDLKLETAVVALAGIDSSKDNKAATRFVRSARLAKKSFVIHDSVAALYTATRGKPGIVVNSGTGCFAAGTSATRKYARVGGWGNLIDDRGSGFDIGMKAILMAFRMMDGRSKRTRLVSVVKRGLRVKMFDEILDLIYVNRIGVYEIARLVPMVSKAASRDKVCRDILKEAGRTLAELVCTAARELRLTRKQFTTYTTGGVFKSGPYLLNSFTSAIKKQCPRTRIVGLEIEPVKGSFWLAAELSKCGLRGEYRDWVTLPTEIR